MSPTVAITIAAGVWLFMVTLAIGLCRAAASGNTKADDDDQMRAISNLNRRPRPVSDELSDRRRRGPTKPLPGLAKPSSERPTDDPPRRNPRPGE